jgi:hypothetical protein
MGNVFSTCTREPERAPAPTPAPARSLDYGELLREKQRMENIVRDRQNELQLQKAEKIINEWRKAHNNVLENQIWALRKRQNELERQIDPDRLRQRQLQKKFEQ